MNQESRAASPKNGPNPQHNADSNMQPSLGKELRMLAMFAASLSLNRFQAERHGDHCLPTTISDLQKRYGIEFRRKQETVPTRFDRPTRVTRYWLEDEHLERAGQIIKGYFATESQAAAHNQEQ